MSGMEASPLQPYGTRLLSEQLHGTSSADLAGCYCYMWQKLGRGRYQTVRVGLFTHGSTSNTLFLAVSWQSQHCMVDKHDCVDMFAEFLIS